MGDGAMTLGIPAAVVALIEQRYWYPIREAALPERFVTDPTFATNPARHPALFSDHGVTHVRDIVRNTDALARLPPGALIADRPPNRLEFVRVVALLLTYLHDIGMVSPTVEGRRVHPQFAAQTALGSGFDDIAEALWRDDVGAIATRLSAVSAAVDLPVSPQRVFREVLAMALCHSKSAIPAPVLDDRPELRRRMLRACFVPLAVQSADGAAALGVDDAWTSGELTGEASIYRSLVDDAFAWLVHPSPEAVEIADDVVDAVRLVRAGDALRQRGTALCTSGGSEICVDPRNGHAVYTLHSTDRARAAVLEVDNIISAAESNIAFADLLPGGLLRIAFNRTFEDSEVRAALVHATAGLVADIEADAVASFHFDSAPPVHLIELDDDAPGFVAELVHACNTDHPALAGRVVAVPADAETAADPDLSWMVGGTPVEPHDPRFVDLVGRMGDRGMRTSAIDVTAATKGVQFVHVRAGTEVLRAGARSPVVLVPVDHGLRALPINGLEPIDLHPWLPVGATGVVRGGERNASVVATRDIEVLVIPASVYLDHWFHPYASDPLVEIVTAWANR